MPSDKALTNVDTGAGKLHANVATAASDLYSSTGGSAMLAAAMAALQREVVVTTRSALVASAGDTSTTLDGSTNPIWVSDDLAEDVLNLFRVVIDGTDDVPVDASGAPIEVASITGATIGDGFYTGASLQLNFTGTIAAAQNYRVYFGIRGTLQTVLTDAFSYPAIRNTLRVSPSLALILKDLHDNTGNDAWDSTWLSTIADLARSGLDDRYRRATLSAGTVDTAGDGAVITRDGQAVTGVATADLGLFFYPTVPPDPYLAHYKTLAGPGPQTDITHRVNVDGGAGYVSIMQQRLTKTSVERLNANAYTQAARMDVIERYFNASTITTANVRTKITPGTNVGTALNPAGTSGFDARRTIQLAIGDYFWEAGSGNKTSEVAVGRDMIEVTYASGDKIICVITELDPSDSRIALIENLTGGGLSFPTTSTSGASFRFIKTKYWQGCGTQQYTDYENGYLIPDGIKLGHLYHAIAPFVTDDITAGSEVEDIGDAEFFARAQTIGQSGVANLSNKPYALKWGGYDPGTWSQVALGGLRGDGAVETTLLNRTVHTETVSSSGTTQIIWHPSLQGSILFIDITHANGSANIDVDFSTDYDTNVLEDGDEILLIARNPTNAPPPTQDPNVVPRADFLIDWPTLFAFTPGQAIGSVLYFNHSSVRTVQQWRGHYNSVTGKFHMIHEVIDIGGDQTT